MASTVSLKKQRKVASAITKNHWRGDFYGLVCQLSYHSSASLQFKVDNFRHYPIQEVASYSKKEGNIWQIVVRAPGLMGSYGVLPDYDCSMLLTGDIEKDLPISAFFDIFNHRLLSLECLSWLRKHPGLTMHYESQDNDKPQSGYQLDNPWLDIKDLLDHSSYHGFLNALGGYVERNSPVSNYLKTHSIFLRFRPLSVETIQSVLNGFFDFKTEVVPFVSSYYNLPHKELSYLSSSFGSMSCLGKNTIIGSRVRMRSNECQLKIGPLNYKDFSKLLPGEALYLALKEMVANLFSSTIQVNVLLLVKSDEIPCARLGQSETRLGLNSWFVSDQGKKESRDVYYIIY